MEAMIDTFSRFSRALFLAFFTLCHLFLLSCGGSDEENQTSKGKDTSSGAESNPTRVDLQEARLTDFELSEIAYKSIDIEQPTIENNTETTRGRILITIPFYSVSTFFSLKGVNFDEDVFGIKPAVGTKVISLSKTPFAFEIYLKNDPDVKIHYDVTLMKEERETTVKDIEITNMTFSALNNSSLSKDVQQLKIVDYQNTQEETTIYMMVPSGTNFADLRATFDHNGDQLLYRVNNELYGDYPNEGLTLNYQYPNRVYFKVDNTEGTDPAVYQVVVDVKNPIKLKSDSISLPDIMLDSSYSIKTNIGTHVGNHPIKLISAGSYKDVESPFTNREVNIFRALLKNTESDGIAPGQQVFIEVGVYRPYAPGEYVSTAEFRITYNIANREVYVWPLGSLFIEDIYDPLTIRLSNKVVLE